MFKPPKQQYKNNTICNEYMSKSFLLVGGSSDIARHLATMLLDDGHHVTLLARDGERVADLVERGRILFKATHSTNPPFNRPLHMLLV